MIRPDMVAWLAEAYRHQGRSALADQVVADRHLDFTPEERDRALAEVQVEVYAEMVVAKEMRRLLGGGES